MNERTIKNDIFHYLHSLSHLALKLPFSIKSPNWFTVCHLQEKIFLLNFVLFFDLIKLYYLLAFYYLTDWNRPTKAILLLLLAVVVCLPISSSYGQYNYLTLFLSLSLFHSSISIIISCRIYIFWTNLILRQTFTSRTFRCRSLFTV